MKCSREQIELIKKVEKVFQAYIRESKEFELLWSEKVGYVLLSGITKDMSDFIMHPKIIIDASQLCFYLLTEIAFDVIKTQDHFHDIHLSSASERELIKTVYLPYMQQLPEYTYLIEEVFADPFE